MPTYDRAPDLSRPHEKFPFWDRSTLYDAVTRMYLDCWDDVEVAHALSDMVHLTVTPELALVLREEAAMAAEASHSPQVRRKWVFRYRNVTPNNLVKEYMFLEGKTDFLKAKRELAQELEALVANTPADRLWIAVNDALGRNNVAMAVVAQLMEYEASARKFDGLAALHAERTGTTPDRALADLASKTDAFHLSAANRDPAKTAVFLARTLRQASDAISPSDVSFLRQYHRIASAVHPEREDFAYRIRFAADVITRPKGALDRILGDRDIDLSSVELNRILDVMLGSPVVSEEDLERILDYAIRHSRHHDVRSRLFGKRTERADTLELQSLKTLRKLAEGHLAIREADRFLSPKELARTQKYGLTPTDAQDLLNSLNALDRRQAVEVAIRQVLEMHPSYRKAFPFDRYLEMRFLR